MYLVKVLVNSLTTVGYLLDVFIKLWIPSTVRIFTSVWSGTGNLGQSFILAQKGVENAPFTL